MEPSISDREGAATFRCMWGALLSILALASTFGLYEPAHAQVCGDADGNGTLTVTDGINVLRAAADLPSRCSFLICDVDGSGAITVTDGVNVLRGAAGLPNVCQGTLQPCGRVAGISCPTRQQCVDIPNDDCDPLRGDADCPGQCEPTSPRQCTVNSECPTVGAPCTLCADSSGACPISWCDQATGQCRVAFQRCPARSCAGFAGLPCPEGQQCIDDPRDACDPNAGGADCPGVCVL